MPRKRTTRSQEQQEAQKYTPSTDESAIDIEATAVNSDSAEDSETADAVQEKESLLVAAEAEKVVLQGTINDLQVTIKDLKTTIKESKDALEEIHQHEEELQQQIIDLQTDLLEQKTLSERLTKELYDAKKDALNLAEENTKLSEEIKSLKALQTQENKQEKAIVKSIQQQYKKSHRYQESPTPRKPPLPVDNSSQSQMWLLD